ncbi:hypothetical protein [Streptomyces sp. NPDC050287]|uniref:hypothetical protein n=1 Tax=Streptomyces sp. NPDC050287 TaxID=3365608 RepID=UPI0037B92DAD
MDISVVAVGREDDSPAGEPLRLVGARRPARLSRGVGRGGPDLDSFVLATAIGRATERVALTAGPVPVSVRDACTIARGAAGVAGAAGAAGAAGVTGSAGRGRPGHLQQAVQAALDEIALVPATAGDPAGERTLTALGPA